MRKLFTLLAANMLIVSGLFAQESGEATFAEQAGKVSVNSQVTRVSPSGKYIAGQEDSESGIMLLWDTENNDYRTVDFKGAGQIWHVTDNGTLLGQANKRPVIFRTDDEEPVYIDTTGQAFGCNADETILVGIADYGDGMYVTPKVWRPDGETFTVKVLDYPADDQNFENGAFAKGISGDGKLIWGTYAAYSYSMVVWRADEAGDYVLDDVTKRLMAQDAAITGIEPEYMSPNGKYITGICYKGFDGYVFRYDTEADKFELIATPANENPSARGWGVADDGTIVSTNEPQMITRVPYIVRSGSDVMVPFAEWLSYSDVDIEDNISNSMSVTLSGISRDGKTIGGYYLGASGYVSFFYHIPGLQLGIGQVTDDIERDDNFCYLSDRQLYIPEGCDALCIYTMAGLPVYTATDNTATVHNLSRLANGIYVVKAEKGGKSLVTKIAL